MKIFTRLVIGVFLVLTVALMGCSMGGTSDLQGNLRNAKVGDFGVRTLPVDATFQARQVGVELLKFEVATKNQPTTTGATFTVEMTGCGWLHAYRYPDLVGYSNLHDVQIVDSAGNTVSELKFRELFFPYNNELDNGAPMQELSNTFSFLEFNVLPAAGTTETYTLLATIEDPDDDPDSFYHDPTTITATLDTLFGTAVNVTGSTITAAP